MKTFVIVALLSLTSVANAVNLSDYFAQETETVYFQNENGTNSVKVDYSQFNGASIWGYNADSMILADKLYWNGSAYCYGDSQPVYTDFNGSVALRGGVEVTNNTQCYNSRQSAANAGAVSYIWFDKGGAKVGLPWGIVGGNTPAMPWSGLFNVNVRRSGNPTLTQTTFSTTHVDEVFPFFFQMSGRNEQCGWDQGDAWLGNLDAVKVSYIYGNSGNYGTYDNFGNQRVIPGYASFGLEVWLVKGVGVIQFRTSFAETGSLGNYSDLMERVYVPGSIEGMKYRDTCHFGLN